MLKKEGPKKMTLDLLHNKIVADTVSASFEASLREVLLPMLAAKYSSEIAEVQMYEDYISDNFLSEGEWYYPFTVRTETALTTEWVKWPIAKADFEDGIPYSFIGEGPVEFSFADFVPEAFLERRGREPKYFGGEAVKIVPSAAFGGKTFLSGKYSQSFIDEMARQITSRIEHALSCSGLASSDISLSLVFAPESYLEHTSENVTYRRLLLADKSGAPRDFWVKWTRLNSAVGYGVGAEVGAEDIIFELGEDVSQKIREKEYRFLIKAGKDKYHNSMGRKNVTEWREVIKRAIRRGDLEKTAPVIVSSADDELEKKLASLLGLEDAPAKAPVEERAEQSVPESGDFARAMELAREAVSLGESSEGEPAEEPESIDAFEIAFGDEEEVLEVEAEEDESEEVLDAPEEDKTGDGSENELDEITRLAREAVLARDEESAYESEDEEEDEERFAEDADEDTEEGDGTSEEDELLSEYEIEDEYPESLDGDEEETFDIGEEEPLESYEEEDEPEEELEEEFGEEFGEESEEEPEEAPEEPPEEPDEDTALTSSQILGIVVPEDATAEEEPFFEDIEDEEGYGEPEASEQLPAAEERTAESSPEPMAAFNKELLEEKIRIEVESEYRIKYEKDARERAEREAEALRAENRALRAEIESLKKEINREHEASEQKEAEHSVEIEKLKAQIELQMRREATERDRLAEAARVALSEQRRMEEDKLRREREAAEENERLELERARAEERARIDEEREREAERIRRDIEARRESEKRAEEERASDASRCDENGRPYTYTQKTVKLLFRRSVDQNIIPRISEIVKATVSFYGKDKIHIRARAAVEDTDTVTLEFVEIPEEEMPLLANIIKVLGNSGLGIAKALVD